MERRTVSTGEAAEFWRVHPETARAILRRDGVRPARGGRCPRWWAADILAVGTVADGSQEGGGPLPPALLAARDCARLDPLGRSPRSWRRIMSSGRIPTIQLAPGITRVRPGDFVVLAEIA